MIVPFPNDVGTQHVGLVNAGETKTFRDSVVRAFPDMRLTSNARLQSYGVKSTDDFAAVHAIGNYNCSVVGSFEELMSRVDWSKFSRPVDFEARVSVFADAYLNLTQCGFVIAEAFQSVENDGFGVVYPGSRVLFPTCHEGGRPMHVYDACCYAFGSRFDALPRDLLTVPPKTLPVNPDWFLTMPLDVTMADTGEYARMDPITATVVTCVKLQGPGANQNLTAQVDDEARLVGISRYFDYSKIRRSPPVLIKPAAPYPAPVTAFEPPTLPGFDTPYHPGRTSMEAAWSMRPFGGPF